MERQNPLEELTDHVVICNCNEKVRRIVEGLQTSAEEPPGVVLLVQDLALWKANPGWHPDTRHAKRFFTVVGCPTDAGALGRARISAARAAVILADPVHGALADARSTLVAIAIERQNPQVHTVMELIASVNRVHLRATEVNEIVCLGDVTEKLIAQCCITPGIKNVFEHLLSTQEEGQEIYITLLPDALAGRSYRELAKLAVRSGAPFVVCGYAQARAHEGAKRRLVINPRSYTEPGRDTQLQPGDALISMAREEPRLELLSAATDG
jgi:voltage-gated potassium channel